MGPSDREITLCLTGNRYRHIWSVNDIKYSEAEPIQVKFGEHVRFHYINETMMNHPIHLHGIWHYLDNGNGMYNPKKHVINVKSGQNVDDEVIAEGENGRFIAICCITWIPACSASLWSRKRNINMNSRLPLLMLLGSFLGKALSQDDQAIFSRFKTEGDYSADQDIFGRADLQMLYSRKIDTF